MKRKIYYELEINCYVGNNDVITEKWDLGSIKPKKQIIDLNVSRFIDKNNIDLKTSFAQIITSVSKKYIYTYDSN